MRCSSCGRLNAQPARKDPRHGTSHSHPRRDEVLTLSAAALAFISIAALWWLYFDVTALIARRRMLEATERERGRLALDLYTYFHFPMIAGIVLFAFGLKLALHDVGRPLQLAPAIGLYIGASLYLVGHLAFMWRATHHLFRHRAVGAAALAALTPLGLHIPATASLAIVAALCGLIALDEVRTRREHRERLREQLIR